MSYSIRWSIALKNTETGLNHSILFVLVIYTGGGAYIGLGVGIPWGGKGDIADLGWYDKIFSRNIHTCWIFAKIKISERRHNSQKQIIFREFLLGNTKWENYFFSRPNSTVRGLTRGRLVHIPCLPMYLLYKYTHCTVHKCTVYVCSKARLWIRINFLQIRIQLFFSMQIRIQSLQICEILPYEEFSGVVKYEKVIKVQKIWSLSNWL